MSDFRVETTDLLTKRIFFYYYFVCADVQYHTFIFQKSKKFYCTCYLQISNDTQAFLEFVAAFGVTLRCFILLYNRKRLEECLKMCEKIWETLTQNDRNYVVFYESKLRLLLKLMLLIMGLSWTLVMITPLVTKLTYQKSYRRDLPFL